MKISKQWTKWLTLIYTGLLPKIKEHYYSYKPDIIVPALNGGMVPAGIICAELEVRDVRPISIGRREEERFFLFPDCGDIGDVRGKKILFIEDDVPTGRSPRFVEEHFLALGALEVLTAAIYEKTGVNSLNFVGKIVDEIPDHPWKNFHHGDRI